MSSLVAILSLLSFLQAALLASGFPQRSPRSLAKSVCTTHGHKGLLKLHSYTNHEEINGTALAEGLLSATTTPVGNNHLTVHFDRCDLPYMNYEQGSSRNSHGSMGAPLEFFGHVRRSQECLTVQIEIDDPMQPKGLHFTPCSYANDASQLSQWFVYQITAGGSIALDYVGARNTTHKPYTGPKYYWDVTPPLNGDMSLFEPRYILVSTYVDYRYSILLDSSTSEPPR